MRPEGSFARSAVVILNYNTAGDAIALARFVLECGEPSLSVILVDNCSRDVAALREFVEAQAGRRLEADTASGVDSMGRLQLVEVRDNRGYAVGNNVGLRLARRCGCEYAFVVNPDVKVTDAGVFRALVEALGSDGTAAFAGPLIRCPNGIQSPGERLDNRLVLRNLAQPFAQGLQRLRERRAIVHRRPLRAYYGIGCFLALDLAKMEQVGYFDEETFLYGEEAILAERFRLRGWTFLYLPHLSVFHDHAFSEDWHRGNAILERSLAHYRTAYLRRSERFWRILALSERYKAGVWSVYAKLKRVGKLRKYLVGSN